MPKKADKKKAADFEVKVPDAVKKQGEKADALMNPKDPADPPKDVIIDNPSDPPKDPDKPVFTPVDPEPPAKEPTKVDPLPVDNQNWKHKYDVLQGMFNAKDGEVKALQQAVNNLQGLVNHLSEQAKAQPAPAPAPVSPAAPVVPATDIKKINLDDVAGYGDEIVYMAQGFNALVDMNQQLITRLNQVGTQAPSAGTIDEARFNRVESFVQETAQDRYVKALDLEVPKWREITASPEFQGWLQNIDPMSGYRYKDMMDFAYQNMRGPQAAAIIRNFGIQTKIDVGVPVKNAPQTVMVGDTNIVDQTRDPLAGQALPDETTGGDQGQTPQTYPTAEDVTKASADYARRLISIEQFNDISNRFQQGLIAAKKAQGR